MNQKPEVWYMGFQAYENQNKQKQQTKEASDQSESSQTDKIEGVYLGRLTRGNDFAADVEKAQKNNLRTLLSFSIYGSREEYNALLNTEVDSVVIVDPHREDQLRGNSIFAVSHAISLNGLIDNLATKGKKPYLHVPNVPGDGHHEFDAFEYFDNLSFTEAGHGTNLEGVIFGSIEDAPLSRVSPRLLNNLVSGYVGGKKIGFYDNDNEKVELDLAVTTKLEMGMGGYYL